MKSFIQILREADRRKLVDDAEDALAQIRAAIEANGGSGEQQAFQAVVEQVKSATGQPVFYGAAG